VQRTAPQRHIRALIETTAAHPRGSSARAGAASAARSPGARTSPGLDGASARGGVLALNATVHDAASVLEDTVASVRGGAAGATPSPVAARLPGSPGGACALAEPPPPSLPY